MRRYKKVCDQCGAGFKSQHPSAKRCSPECKKAAINSLRQTKVGRSEWKVTLPDFYFGLDGLCSYCGGKHEQTDHCIPVSFLRPTRKGFDPCGPMTFSCTLCNQALGSKLFLTFKERVDFVQGYHAKTARKKFGKAPLWELEEIAKLDHTLRTYVATKQFEMREYDRKTTWVGSSGWLRLVDNIRQCPMLDKSSPKFNSFYWDFFESII